MAVATATASAWERDGWRRATMVLLASQGEWVCPGDKLGLEEEVAAGPGAYAAKGFVFSSVVGQASFDQALGQGQRTASVVAAAAAGTGGAGPAPAEGEVPGSSSSAALAIGDEVLARVNSLNPRFALTAIVCKGSAPLVKEFTGIIRVQDVRATEIDKVTILSSFRPGDIVRAEVISLGESQSLLLSTAKDHLGVLHTKSQAEQPRKRAKH